ncbi:MAG TPA: class I SAM-dependent methyltransferase [Planctomycetaceae bacterium]|nr:class I SAM-dependent methyltransferase [Planctomycetaceae bacterium]
MTIPPTDSTARFSSRVDHYVRYRPGYPPEVWDALTHAVSGLHEGAVIADIGSGTGISARLFLEHHCIVHAVEPNAAMRVAAERDLTGVPNFHSHDGTAEATGLPDASVDLVVAAQAFHWFDPTAAKREFARISRNDGWCALIWNTRRLDSTPFLRDYEAFLTQFGTDYLQVRHQTVDRDRLAAFFTTGWTVETLYNEQRFDREGLHGRVLSSSYTPGPEDPRHAPMLAALDELFDRHQYNSEVAFEYDTEIFLGRVTPG